MDEDDRLVREARIDISKTVVRAFTWTLAVLAYALPAQGENWVAWVGTQGANTLVAFDTATGARVTRISLGNERAAISDVVTSPDGALVYVSTASSISSFEAATGVHQRTMRTNCLDNRMIGRANGEGILALKDWNCQVVSLFDSSHQHMTDLIDVSETRPYGRVDGIALSPDSSSIYLSIGWYDSPNDRDVAELWEVDIATGDTLRTLSPGGAPAGEVAISPNGAAAYLSAWDGVTVVDSETLETVSQIPTQKRPVGFVFSPDGLRAYITSADALMFVDATTHQIENAVTLPAPGGRPAITPDGSRVLVPITDALGTVVVVDTSSAEIVDRITVGARPIAVAVAALPQPTATPTPTRQSTIDRDPEPLQACVLAAHSQGVSLIDPDARRVVATVAIGPHALDQEVTNVELEGGGVAIAPDGRSIYATAAGFGGAGAVVVIDSVDHVVTGRIDVGCNPTKIAVHPRGQFAYVAQDTCPESSIAVLDLEREEAAAAFFGPQRSPRIISIVFAPDGGRAYITTTNPWDNPTVVDASTHMIIGRLPAFPTGVYYPYQYYGNTVSISPAGQYLYVPQPYDREMGKISEVSVHSGAVTREISLPLEGHPDRIAVSPDGRTIFATVLPHFSCKDHPSTGYCILKPDAIVAIDSATGAWTSVMTARGFLGDLAISVDGTQLYATVDDSLVVIETDSMATVDTIALPDGVSAIASGMLRGGCRSQDPPTPVATRTPTSTWPPRVTATPKPSPSPTVVPAECQSGCVELDMGHIRTLPGQVVTLEGRLRSAGFPIAGVQAEIAFAPTTEIGARFDDVPLCETAGPFRDHIGEFAFNPWYCWVGIDCTSLKALMYATVDVGATAEDTTIFRCPLSIPADAEPRTYTFEVRNVVVADATGQALPARGIAGRVDVFPDNGTPIPPLPSQTPTRRPPSKTPTPTSTATQVSGPPTNATTPTASATPTTVETSTAPAQAVIIGVDSNTGIPGTETTVGVRLATAANIVLGVQNDLTFDPVAPVLRCRGNPDLSKTVAFAFHPLGCVRGSTCEAVRAIVFSIDNVDPIPDDALLYTCTVRIADDAPPGSYRLAVSNTVAAGPGGLRFPSSGRDGAILVTVTSSTSTSQPADSALGRSSARASSGCEVRPVSGRGFGLWFSVLMVLLVCCLKRGPEHRTEVDALGH